MEELIEKEQPHLESLVNFQTVLINHLVVRNGKGSQPAQNVMRSTGSTQASSQTLSQKKAFWCLLLRNKREIGGKESMHGNRGGGREGCDLHRVLKKKKRTRTWAAKGRIDPTSLCY